MIHAGPAELELASSCALVGIAGGVTFAPLGILSLGTILARMRCGPFFARTRPDGLSCHPAASAATLISLAVCAAVAVGLDSGAGSLPSSSMARGVDGTAVMAAVAATPAVCCIYWRPLMSCVIFSPASLMWLSGHLPVDASDSSILRNWASRPEVVKSCSR